jgi:hypothetical protein
MTLISRRQWCLYRWVTSRQRSDAGRDKSIQKQGGASLSTGALSFRRQGRQLIEATDSLQMFC